MAYLLYYRIERLFKVIELNYLIVKNKCKTSYCIYIHLLINSTENQKQ